VYSVLLARDSMYAIARYMLSPVRLSEVRVMQLSPQISSMTLSFLSVNFNTKFRGEYRERERRMREG